MIWSYVVLLKWYKYWYCVCWVLIFTLCILMTHLSYQEIPGSNPGRVCEDPLAQRQGAWLRRWFSYFDILTRVHVEEMKDGRFTTYGDIFCTLRSQYIRNMLTCGRMDFVYRLPMSSWYVSVVHYIYHQFNESWRVCAPLFWCRFELKNYLDTVCTYYTKYTTNNSTEGLLIAWHFNPPHLKKIKIRISLRPLSRLPILVFRDLEAPSVGIVLL